ncbi:MAG: threonylcarbamoyl-AMP synthase, partial [Dysgonamonadaceae bacterium]|jgi:L-threonylcarbamoyladenylate synthase|nr:threonylcarbamoyl-AMP synthase [Dysgonamonadaceae bacterium]
MYQANEIANALQSGGAILIATDTVYGLAALPSIPEAVEKIYLLKKRPKSMYLPIMVAKIEDLEKIGFIITENAKKIFKSDLVPGAVTFILEINKEKTTPDWMKNRTEAAIRIPDNKLLLNVLEETGPLFVTSANLHGVPQTPNNVKDILAELNGTPDLIVEDGEGKEIPSTIINCRFNPPKIERYGLISEATITKILEK